MGFVKWIKDRLVGVSVGPYVKIGVAIGLVWSGFWLGSTLKQGEWDRADNETLTEQIRLTDEANEKRIEAERLYAKERTRLAQSETHRLELSNRLNEEINREPLVKKEYIACEDDSEPVSVAVIDSGKWFRLFNAAITATPQDVPDSITTGFSNGSLWDTDYLARLDGGGGP